MRLQRFWFLAVLTGLAALDVSMKMEASSSGLLPVASVHPSQSLQPGSGVLQVCGIQIYTSGNVEAVNGTDVRLKCTFQSSAQINSSLAVVSWTFRPLAGGQEISLFHYQQQPYPPLEGIFRKKIVWAGDLMGGDASIIIREVKFAYNGTYICQVKNPPDVHGPVGEIQLRVVLTASFSDLLILAVAIGSTIGCIVLLLVISLCCRRCRNRRRPEGNIEASCKEREDPAAW